MHLYNYTNTLFTLFCDQLLKLQNGKKELRRAIHFTKELRAVAFNDKWVSVE